MRTPLEAKSPRSSWYSSAYARARTGFHRGGYLFQLAFLNVFKSELRVALLVNLPCGNTDQLARLALPTILLLRRSHIQSRFSLGSTTRINFCRLCLLHK